MAISALGDRTGSITVDLDALAEEAIAEPLDGADKLEKFRRRAVEAYGGKVPAAAKEDYSRALLKVVAPQHRVAELRATDGLTASLATSRRRVSALSGQLAVLEASNQRSYQTSMDALRAMQE